MNAPLLSAVSLLNSTPALPLTDARHCPDCGGDGYEVDDGKRCCRCLGHGRICVECYQSLGEYDPAVLAADTCNGCVEHTTTIETTQRGRSVGNQELHLYHRWLCSCGAVGPWGHSLWAKNSIRSAEISARDHVARAQESAS